nr:MAG TPA_asm: hypothetical protein [Caudoviricetes sp.]
MTNSSHETEAPVLIAGASFFHGRYTTFSPT